MPQTLTFDLSFAEEDRGAILVKAVPRVDGSSSIQGASTLSTFACCSRYDTPLSGPARGCSTASAALLHARTSKTPRSSRWVRNG